MEITRHLCLKNDVDILFDDTRIKYLKSHSLQKRFELYGVRSFDVLNSFSIFKVFGFLLGGKSYDLIITDGLFTGQHRLIFSIFRSKNTFQLFHMATVAPSILTKFGGFNEVEQYKDSLQKSMH